MLFPDSDDLRMEVIVQPNVPREIRLEVRPDLLVPSARVPSVAPKDADRVRVHDEYGTAKRVEEDRIGRLRADPPDREQVRSKPIRAVTPHPGEAAAVSAIQVCDEGVELARLLAKVTRRTNRFLEGRGLPRATDRHSRS